MHKLISCLLIGLLTFGLAVNDASAKRFGGGRSFGVQRSKSSLFTPRAAHANKPMGQRANASKWGGVLGGILVGGLLTSLFMGHGLGSGLLSWLILGSIAFFVVGFLRKRMQPGFQAAYSGAFRQDNVNNSNFSASTNRDNQPDYPNGFMADPFLREAKVTFIRLQAAYDQNNLQDLSTFTAPEVFAEIKMQLEEGHAQPNKTEVITLDAQLLDVSEQADGIMASIHFTGSIKENNDPIMPLDEIWHFRRFSNSNNWVVGGIQQGT